MTVIFVGLRKKSNPITYTQTYFHVCNNCYVLVIQDYFIKWVEAFTLPNDQAVTVAKVLASEGVL